jgi:hypothetical protein
MRPKPPRQGICSAVKQPIVPGVGGMTETRREYDVIADFWEWYRRREERQSNPLASYALDKCEETFRKCQWNSFGHWYEIYLRERPRSSFSRGKPSDQN